MRRRAGYTLLEVLVATTVMAVAVSGLLAALSTSLGNAARLTGHDRAALAARRTMDELLTLPRLPRLVEMEGAWDPAMGVPGGWRARVSPFEMPPAPGPRARVLDRIELEVWWMSGDRRRTFTLEAFRAGMLEPEDLARMGAQP